MSLIKKGKGCIFKSFSVDASTFLFTQFALNHSVRANGVNGVRSLGLSECQDSISDSKHKIILKIGGKYISLDMH